MALAATFLQTNRHSVGHVVNIMVAAFTFPGWFLVATLDLVDLGVRPTLFFLLLFCRYEIETMTRSCHLNHSLACQHLDYTTTGLQLDVLFRYFFLIEINQCVHVCFKVCLICYICADEYRNQYFYYLCYRMQNPLMRHNGHSSCQGLKVFHCSLILRCHQVTGLAALQLHETYFVRLGWVRLVKIR